MGRIFVEILHAAFVYEKVGFSLACDSDNVFIVVLDPASNLFAINQFHNDGSSAFRETVDIFGLPESVLWRALAPISAAGVFVRCSYCHALLVFSFRC